MSTARSIAEAMADEDMDELDNYELERQENIKCVLGVPGVTLQLYEPWRKQAPRAGSTCESILSGRAPEHATSPDVL
jgi:hypothetical protein